MTEDKLKVIADKLNLKRVAFCLRFVLVISKTLIRQCYRCYKSRLFDSQHGTVNVVENGSIGYLLGSNIPLAVNLTGLTKKGRHYIFSLPPIKRIRTSVTAAIKSVRNPAHNQNVPLTLERKTPSRKMLPRAILIARIKGERKGGRKPQFANHNGAMITREISKGERPLTKATSTGT